MEAIFHLISYSTNTIPTAIVIFCSFLTKAFYIGFIYDILMYIGKNIVIKTVNLLGLDVIELSHGCDEIITKA